MIRTFFQRLRFLRARDRFVDETCDELQFHLEQLTSRYCQSGMPADEARAAAQRQLGNATLVREDIYWMNGVRWVDALRQDLRYAFRVLSRNRAFAAGVIATLALGIGGNTAILSIVYSSLLKPLPYPKAEQLFSVEIVVPERREQIPSLPATVQTFLRWRAAETPFAGMAAVTPWEASLVGGNEPERLGGARVSANFFTVLGVPVARGRSFFSEEERPGQDKVVVISDGLWRRRYGSDPSVIGRTVMINGESHAVVGIAPASLLIPIGSQLHSLLAFAPRIDIWKPIAATPRELNNESWDHGVLVRLPDPAHLDQGRQQLAGILNEMVRQQMPGVESTALIELIPLREIYSGKVRLRLMLVLAAAGLLLLTACASMANVFLARVASRANEFATRVALGASRARILSQTLTETVVLAGLGGAFGAALATFAVGLLAAHGPEEVRLLADTRVNAPLLVLAVSVSLMTGLACGIVPAWQAYRQDPGMEIQQSARTSLGGPRAARSRQWIVGVEIALATVLLASAGLLLHSFVKVMNTDRGYDIERVLAADISLFGERYGPPAARAAFYESLVNNVRGLPGVVAAGAISNLPAVSASSGASRTVFYPGDTDFQRTVLSRPVAMIRAVTTGYFTASGAVLEAGRFFVDEEPRLAAVISQSLARRLWPGEPLDLIVGREIRHDVKAPLISVIGIVADEQPGGLEREPPPAVYRPYAQWSSGPMTVVMRTTDDPAGLAGAVRSAVGTLDANIPIASLRTMREIVSSTVAERRFQMALTMAFAVVALLLGAIGVYGVVSYAVACGTRAIGLRMALGAASADVMRRVFANGMQPVVIGLTVGIGGSIVVARVLRGVLFGVTPTDPLSLGAAVLVLLGASALACYVPARRAARLDPMTALRHE